MVRANLRKPGHRDATPTNTLGGAGNQPVSDEGTERTRSVAAPLPLVTHAAHSSSAGECYWNRTYGYRRRERLADRRFSRAETPRPASPLSRFASILHQARSGGNDRVAASRTNAEAATNGSQENPSPRAERSS